MEILSVGNVVSFFYPAANYQGARSDLEQRQIRITKVRDLRDEPLDLVTMTICPTLRRGTVLVTGLDLQKGVERSFYVESMTELRMAPEESKLNRLNIFITQEPGGSFVRFDSVADPRESYIKHFNALPHSFRAWPITV